MSEVKIVGDRVLTKLVVGARSIPYFGSVQWELLDLVGKCCGVLLIQVIGPNSGFRVDVAMHYGRSHRTCMFYKHTELSLMTMIENTCNEMLGSFGYFIDLDDTLLMKRAE